MNVRSMGLLLLCSLGLHGSISFAQITAIRAGEIIDPDTGTATRSQVILVEGHSIKAIGPNIAIPSSATVIDLTNEVVLPGLSSGLAESQSVALTFDDGPDMSDKVGLSPADRNAAILKQLADAHLKSILFVTRTDTDPNRNELIRQWGTQGHEIGNHTATHPDFDEVSLADYEQQLLTCEKAIQKFPGFTRRFRFPYLKEGDTVEKRDGFRAFLATHGYHSGAVSIDASDWYYSQRLIARLKKQPGADTTAYRDAYLRHLYDRAQYYDGLSRLVLGRSVSHVLLLHHNLINALYLADVIRMFRDKGWTLINSEVAFQDPVYALQPNTLPAGQSILWALAKEKGIPGLRFPGEDDTYEKPILDRSHL